VTDLNGDSAAKLAKQRLRVGAPFDVTGQSTLAIVAELAAGSDAQTVARQARIRASVVLQDAEQVFEQQCAIHEIAEVVRARGDATLCRQCLAANVEVSVEIATGLRLVNW